MRPPGSWTRRGFAVALTAGGVIALAACGSPEAERGTAPAGAEVSFAFGLDRDQTALADRVWEISTPSSEDYTQFLSLSEIADQFGASQETVDQALATLTEAGFDGAADPTRGVITGTFSVLEAEAFLGVSLDETMRNDGTAYISPREDVKVPRSLQPGVVEVFGGWSTTDSDPGSTTTAAPPAEAPTADPPCPSNERGIKGRAVIDQLYGLTPYYQAGLTGKGVRIGMLSIGHYSERALELYERCYNRNVPPIELTEVNAPAEFLEPENVETSLDLIYMGVMAPGIDAVNVFQFDKVSSLVFPLAEVLDAQPDPAKAVDLLTTSVGFCAANLNEDERSMSDWLAASLAASGVSFLASSGDGGSSSCPPDKEPGTQYPSESAFATSIGGTQLEDIDTPNPSQSVWNDSPKLPLAGGGGPSVDTPRPPYQSNLAGPETRQTPDVAFIAAPGDFGTVAYCDRGEECKFQVVAGTSATAPGVAAIIAMLLEDLRTSMPDQRLGLLNPAIYEFAESPQYEQTFLDVTQGNNDVYDVGCCTAAPGYDMASGWGSARFDEFTRLITEAIKARA